MAESPDLAYALHRAVDSISLPIAARVLKLGNLEIPRQRFCNDFLEDTGIVNLLRRDYLRHGRIAETFDLYQSSRLEPRSYRFESVITMLVITIVGTVVADLITDLYKENKAKISDWLRQSWNDNPDAGSADQAPALDLAVAHKSDPLVKRFCSSRPTLIFDDLTLIGRCFAARRMHDARKLTFGEYTAIVNALLTKTVDSLDSALVSRFTTLERDFAAREQLIPLQKLQLAIDAYAKGMLDEKLAAVGVRLDIPQESNQVAAIFRGIPASTWGAVTGIAHIAGDEPVPANHPMILVADSASHEPGQIVLILASAGVVTTNCGVTGHIPVTCRGIGKSCVILGPDEFARIRSGDPVGLDGATGVVGVGLVVKLQASADRQDT